jgi:hypothetical protein
MPQIRRGIGYNQPTIQSRQIHQRLQWEGTAMTTFAGFVYPFTFAILPRGPLSTRLAEFKRTHGKRTCGPYYRTEPSPNPRVGFFYLDSDFMPGLRWEWADEVEGAHVNHTGWYCDEFQDSKIRGLVMRLPRSRGFIAGWSMGEQMASNLDYTVSDNAVDAARDADRMAERAAEDEREYQERENERLRLEDGAEETGAEN